MTGIQKRGHVIAAHLRKRIGLRRRMLAFFEANPHEDLTIEQLAVKFDAKVATIRVELSRLKGEGAIESLQIFRLRAEVE